MATAAERRAAEVARKEAEGLVQCNVWVPRRVVPDFRHAAELCREDHNLTIGRLVSLKTGRLSSLKSK